MEPEFWHQRWREGRIGFHQDRVTPLLERYWPAVGAAPGSRVLGPLCGKTLDMPWLAAQGHRVLGVEFSRMAVEQFFDEQALVPRIHQSPSGTHFAAGAIEIVCGDAFALDDELLSGCSAVYDRAALIALPEALRDRYAASVYGRLPPGCRGLLVTLEYPQHEKAGPPFSADEAEVRRLYARDWAIESLERRDILASQPGFAAEGVTALHTAAWRLTRRG